MNGLGKDLARLLEPARVRTDPEDLRAYMSDALHYYRPSMPDAVVLPVTTEEVAKVLAYACANDVPVTPRGAGSGLAGGCTPLYGGIVLDMKRMNRILEIDRDNMTATAEAGVVLARFHRTVERMNLFYPPDPQSMSVCTLGGNVATRAGGPRGVKYGTTPNYVLGLEVVLPDGEIIRTGGKVVKMSTGYDITKLMCGSEGTLGVVTGVTVRLLPLPPAHRTVMVTCETLDQSAELVADIIAAGAVPAMLELLMNMAIVVMNNYITPPLSVGAGAYLLMEFDGIEAQVEHEIAKVREICEQKGVQELRIIEDEKEAASYWEGRSKLYPLMTTVYRRAVTEDVTVPRNRIPELVRAAQDVSFETGIAVGIAGHAGDGNMHPSMLMMDISSETEAKANTAIEKIVRKGLGLGGTISGEHGIGMHKAAFLEWELGKAQIELFKRIKQAFDPKNIMNPGKIWVWEGGERC